MRVLLADDHELIGELLQLALPREWPECRVDVTKNLGEALEAAAKGPVPDLVLLDINMPGMDGANGIRAFKKLHPGVPVAVMSGVISTDQAPGYLAAGAAGFIPKTLGLDKLVAALSIMLEGEIYLPNDLAVAPSLLPVLSMADSPPLPPAPEAGQPLTPRETEMLDLLISGLSNKMIARKVGIVEATVKSHLQNLYRKIGARNRTDAVRIALTGMGAANRPAPPAGRFN